MANVFVSYARRDRDRVLGLVTALEHEGLSVWWDPNLVPGKRFRDIIARELDAADCVVVVWTAASIRSDYVQDEAEDARERGVLVPVKLEEVKPPAGFRQVQAADLSQWTGSDQHPEFRVLLSAVHTLVHAARADEADARAEPGAAAASPGQVPPAASVAAPAIPPQPVGPHDLPLLPRLFDLFSRPLVWVTAAVLVAAAGIDVGFGLSGAAAATVIWAGATAQACARLGPNRKMMVMVVSLGVALIVGASSHSASGAVTAILVGSAIFAVYGSILLASRRGVEQVRALRGAARRSDYRMHAADIEHEVLERIRRRHRGRSRRARSGAAPED
ncbi:MAG TPA: toll/interleukin-1 receptor domain-containing protein [Caulobacteraceae bacterium]|nr:toll/interleukin-1 receptor domain-containing protein [Caulobacteraceae bacterium]